MDMKLNVDTKEIRKNKEKVSSRESKRSEIMSKGPRLNNINRSLTTRDSLGIEGVATSISGEICPIVNTVTPRPFYWAFIIWCYYDFYKSVNPKERNSNNVNKYIKMQNYFLALASVLNKNDITNGFTGANTIRNTENLSLEKYSYNEKYLKTMLSNMVYYPAGLYSMNFLLESDPETGEKYKYAHISKEGEKLAKAFEEIISKTQYYQKYRNTGIDVPVDVLCELNNTVKINLVGFEKVKTILRDNLFNRNRTRNLIKCHDYLKYVFSSEKIYDINMQSCRKIFFDYYSPRGLYKKEYPEELKEIIADWEIIVGRQYFTTGLEMIWKFMLEQLNTAKNKNNWFKDCFNNSNFSLNLDDELETVLKECNYGYEIREQMIDKAKSERENHNENMENGLKIILSIYNRFFNRDDLEEKEKNYFNYGEDNNSISLSKFFTSVDEYKKKPIIEFLNYIMCDYLLEQHLDTAFEKIMQGRDGYYIEQIEDEYIRKEYFDIDFQGIRMVQLASVMKDLNILENKYV